MDFAWELKIQEPSKDIICTGMDVGLDIKKIKRKANSDKTEFTFEAKIPDEALEYFGLVFENEKVKQAGKFYWKLYIGGDI